MGRTRRLAAGLACSTRRAKRGSASARAARVPKGGCIGVLLGGSADARWRLRALIVPSARLSTTFRSTLPVSSVMQRITMPAAASSARAALRGSAPAWRGAGARALSFCVAASGAPCALIGCLQAGANAAVHLTQRFTAHSPLASSASAQSSALRCSRQTTGKLCGAVLAVGVAARDMVCARHVDREIALQYDGLRRVLTCTGPRDLVGHVRHCCVSGTAALRVQHAGDDS
jgi:hypothetical protein